MHTLISDPELRALNERFETATPQEIVRWALEDSGIERIAVASAFQAEGTCVMHMASLVRPDVEVLFLETGFHFAETLAFKEQLAERLGLTITDLVGAFTVEQQQATFGERLYERDPGLCCDINKVRPMFEALQKLDAWVTAFRRDSSPTRATAPILDRYELEPGRPMLKINPVAGWTRRDTWTYLKENDLPHNPLYDLGYASIGCAPCTRMRFDGEPERAGRWAGLSRWECGIHQRETRVEIVDPSPGESS
ncbi:MAG TPA: phosphoadenylyl-sulfate reductase [Actinomycetota bacterium]|nr:phosphoadenylyl-sulfate reductase [Actinomycetota bacterium]